MLDEIKEVLEKEFGKNVEVKEIKDIKDITPLFIEISIKVQIPKGMQIVRGDILTKEYSNLRKKVTDKINKIIKENELNFFESYSNKPQILINFIPVYEKNKGGDYE